jgi:hypothetical protein
MARAANRGKTKPGSPKSSSVHSISEPVHTAPGGNRVATSPVSPDASRPTKTAIFELETFAVEFGRKLVFESAKQTLSQAGFSLTPMLFRKMGIESTPSSFFSAASQVLNVRAPSQPRLKAAFDDNCRKALCERPALRNGLTGLLTRARARGIRPVAISLLDGGTAGELMKAAGLADLEVELIHGKGWVIHPYTENIVNRAVNRLGVLPGACVTLVSSGAAAEAALCAGTRVVAVPDSFTSFQDFGGVDEVLDTWSPEVVESMLSLDGEGHG